MIENPEIWVQNGAVGISIALIVLLGIVLKYGYKLVTNHMMHSDKIHKNTAEIQGRLIEVIKTNSKVMDRVERKLDKNGFK